MRKSATSVSSVHRQEQHDAAHRVACDSLRRRLGTAVDSEVAMALRRPAAATDVQHLAQAADLLLALETAFVASIASHTEAEAARRATAMVRRDVGARLGEITVLAAQKAPESPAARHLYAVWGTRSSVSTMLASFFAGDSVPTTG